VSATAVQVHPVIGALRPYTTYAALFGDTSSPFDEFETATMQGLAWVRGDRLDILAIGAKTPGRGDCGRFLAACMKAYQTIVVWDVLNSDLAQMLERRGFVNDWQYDGGASQPVMIWRAPPTSEASSR
jgi:hypothetical protein